MMQCHRCPYNGKADAHCISCDGTEQYSYRYQQYILEGYDAPEPQDYSKGSDPCTSLDEETEDRFRKALYDLFDLQPLELLMLQAIIQGKSLTDFSNDIQKSVAKLNQNESIMTRHHAYQLRKSIARKLPQLKEALITQGQRKPIRG